MSPVPFWVVPAARCQGCGLGLVRLVVASARPPPWRCPCCRERLLQPLPPGEPPCPGAPAAPN